MLSRQETLAGGVRVITINAKEVLLRHARCADLGTARRLARVRPADALRITRKCGRDEGAGALCARSGNVAFAAHRRAVALRHRGAVVTASIGVAHRHGVSADVLGGTQVRQCKRRDERGQEGTAHRSGLPANRRIVATLEKFVPIMVAIVRVIVCNV